MSILRMFSLWNKNLFFALQDQIWQTHLVLFHTAKKLSGFLRHTMTPKQYCKLDGSMALPDVEKAIGINADSILVAANPAYDKDRKQRFLVIERFFPNGQRGTYIAALAGHSLPVIPPPGHYQLGIESLT